MSNETQESQAERSKRLKEALGVYGDYTRKKGIKSWME